MVLFTLTTKLDPGAHGVRCAWAMAVHHAVGISSQRNSGYRPSRVNIMAQGLSTTDPSLSPTHLSIKRGHATTTHYTYHQVSLNGVTQHYTSPFPGVSHWASLWGRPQRWHTKGACATPKEKERKPESNKRQASFFSQWHSYWLQITDRWFYAIKVALPLSACYGQLWHMSESCLVDNW